MLLTKAYETEKLQNQQLAAHMVEMNQLFSINEEQRKTLSEICTKGKLENERMKNREFELKQ